MPKITEKDLPEWQGDDESPEVVNARLPALSRRGLVKTILAVIFIFSHCITLGFGIYAGSRDHNATEGILDEQDAKIHYSNGYNAGYRVGHSFGYSDGYNAGYDIGYSFGHTAGHIIGYGEGYRAEH